MKNFITIDTETCGLHGVIVLLQWAKGFDGEIHLESIWKQPIKDVIALLEMITNNPDGILAFNAAYDWFHIYKMWTILQLMDRKDKILEDCLDEFADKEILGRDSNICLKPHHCFDLMLHARKTHYQSTMDRKDIKIKKVPTPLARPLAAELEKRLKFKEIYFARRKDKNQPHWQVEEVKDAFGDYDPNWKNIVVRFAPSSALKALAADIFAKDDNDIIKFQDISVRKSLYPLEVGFAPFHKAVKEAAKLGLIAKQKIKNIGAIITWPDVIKEHILHWTYNERARQYAGDDIDYTRNIYKFFDSPPFDDDDSVLAFMVGAVRWRGFSIDLDAIRKLKEKAKSSRYKIVGAEKYKIPISPKDVKRYILDALSPIERAVLKETSDDVETSTNKRILEKLSKRMIDCPDCHGDPGDTRCERCQNEGEIKHTVALRAQEVLDARQSKYKINFYDKLLTAGRLHASFKVIGAKSSRMSGADNLNAQGIDRSKLVRSAFTLAFSPWMILCGGDFAGFEVTLAAAAFNDDKLNRALLTCEKCKGEMIFNHQIRDYECIKCGSNEGQAFHGIFGMKLYPGMTYEQIKATKGHPTDDKYTKSKSGTFTVLYGGTEHSFKQKLGIEPEIALKAIDAFGKEYPGFRKERKRIHDQFCAMRQPDGIGTKVIWDEPAEKAETMFGFPRYFTLENQICKVLFTLAQKTPQAWKELKLKVQRRERVQTASGAVSSALYGAAFTIQQQNMRAALNHRIQGGGAQVTKKVQCAIWSVQPKGISEWKVINCNVHDEILAPCVPEVAEQIKQVVSDTVEVIRKDVPLIKLDWRIGAANWSKLK